MVLPCVSNFGVTNRSSSTDALGKHAQLLFVIAELMMACPASPARRVRRQATTPKDNLTPLSALESCG
jgi:hypothetical protein